MQRGRIGAAVATDMLRDTALSDIARFRTIHLLAEPTFRRRWMRGAAMNRAATWIALVALSAVDCARGQVVLRADAMPDVASTVVGRLRINASVVPVARSVTFYDTHPRIVQGMSGLAEGRWIELYPMTERGELAVAWAATIPDAGTIIVGGPFDAIDGEPFAHIAMLDHGVWRDLGGGLGPVGESYVLDLAVRDGPGGREIFVAGAFFEAGGKPAQHIARWDGAAWDPLGFGPGSVVSNIALYDDGAGETVYASGGIDSFTRQIYQYTDGSWEPIGTFTGGDVGIFDMVVFDDGAGPHLYVGGRFIEVDGAPIRSLARWDGKAWEGVGSERLSAVRQVLVHDFGDGARLCAGSFGSFVIDGVSCSLASWNGVTWTPIDPTSAPISPSGLKTFLSMGSETDSLWVTGALGDGSSGSIRYYGVSPACAIADCDADGSTTFFDYLCFLNAYAAGDLGAADCDGDGSLTFFDFLCFQDAFAEGCP